MKFRHLIAVPFEGRGSELTEISADGHETSIIPACEITVFEFNLIVGGFTRLAEILEIPHQRATQFTFHQKENAIHYTDLPAPTEISDHLLAEPVSLLRYALRRESYIIELYSLLSEIASLGPGMGPESSVDPCRRLVELVQHAVQWILPTVCFDERLIALVLAEQPDLLRELRSPFTRAWRDQSPVPSYVKRLHPGTDLWFCAVRPTAFYTPDDLAEALETASDTAIQRACALITHDMAEELAFLWSSVFITMSTLMTRAVGDYTGLLELPVDEALTRIAREWKEG
ncbi:hypothetical protein [Actinomadura sp. GTD37]|uniref:hypothetical protein n=1 Tax=Actinomadura sp. GTD37 TaxID=1778030 RepID=UPI0035C04159